jgi:hypothetical protein
VNFKFDDSGLRKLEKNVEKLSSKDQVNLEEMFTNSFMSRHTNFESFNEFLEKSGLQSSEEFVGHIETEGFNNFVEKETSFENWDDMQESAFHAFISSQLGF